MAIRFNPLTGNFDFTGSGGGGGSSYIDGEVQNFSALPQTIGSPAVDSAYLVREAEGTWLLARKPAGIYIRTDDTGVRADDWTYAGEFPDVFNDANLVVYSNADSTKNLKFDVGSISSGQTRTLTVPDANITIENTGHAAKHHTGGTDAIAPNNIGAGFALVLSTQTISADTLLSAGRNRRITLFAVGTTANVDLPHESNTAGDAVTVVSSFISSCVLTMRRASVMSGGSPISYSTLATLNTSGQSFTFVSDGTATGWTLRGVDTHTHAAADITSGTLDNARVNFAAPSAIGGTTAAAGSFTTLSATGIVTGSNATAGVPTTIDQAKGLQFSLLGGTFGSTAGIYGSYNGTSTLGIGIANGSSGSLTQVAAFTSTGLSVTGGTITASAPALNVQQTWNGAGVNFVAAEINVTRTASSNDAELLRLSENGSPVMYFRRTGQIVATQITLTATGGSILVGGNTNVWFGGNGNSPALVSGSSTVLELRNQTNAMEFRVNGTFTSATNFQRLTIKTKAVTLSGLTGASVATTTGFIPDGAVLVGLTTRVSTAITGATGYDIGDGSDADRWGANVAIALNTSSDNTNWTAGTIECFTAAQEVTLTAVGSNFTGGAVVIVAHYLAGEAD
jgi:hypothetical protein